MSDAREGDNHLRHFDALATQGVDLDTMGLAYGRRALPSLDGIAPAPAYVQGFAAGVHATLMLWQLVMARDWGEFYARLYDPDVLPLADVPPTAGPAGV